MYFLHLLPILFFSSFFFFFFIFFLYCIENKEMTWQESIPAMAIILGMVAVSSIGFKTINYLEGKVWKIWHRFFFFFFCFCLVLNSSHLLFLVILHLSVSYIDESQSKERDMRDAKNENQFENELTENHYQYKNNSDKFFFTLWIADDP